MTVAELILELKKYPMDAEVYYMEHEYGYTTFDSVRYDDKIRHDELDKIHQEKVVYLE